MNFKKYLHNKIIDYIEKEHTKNSEKTYNNIKNNKLLKILNNKNFRNNQNYIFWKTKRFFLLNYLFDDYNNLNSWIVTNWVSLNWWKLIYWKLNNLEWFKKNYSFKYFFRKIFWLFFIIFLILVFRSFSWKFEDIFAIIIFLPVFLFIVWVYFSTIQNKYKKYQKIFMIDKNNIFYFLKK